MEVEGKRMVPIRQAAKIIGVSRATVWRRIQDDELPAYSTGRGGRAYIAVADLEKYIASLRRQSGEE